MLEAPVYPREPKKYPLPLPQQEGNGRHKEALTLLLEGKIEYLLAQMKQKELREEQLNRQHLMMEAAIVGLIVVEVVLFCYDLFFKA